MRRYLDDNFTNRPELISPNPLHQDDHEVGPKKQQYKGTGPKTRDGELRHLLILKLTLNLIPNLVLNLFPKPYLKPYPKSYPKPRPTPNSEIPSRFFVLYVFEIRDANWTAIPD